MLLGPSEINTPENNFKVLWKEFDMLYGSFIVKQINWDSLYSVYSPMVNASSNDHELYEAITGLLNNLNDNHILLLPTNPDLPSYQSGILGRLKTFHDFKLSNVKNNYLAETHVISDEIIYGKFSNNIGYIHFNGFSKNFSAYEKSMDEILNYMQSTSGLIFDIRNHSGGLDKSAVYIAGRFAKDKKLALSFRLRNGPNHSDFSKQYSYYVKPEGKSQYTKEVVLLTHRFTLSAAESFTLTMKRLDNVTVIGDTTSGALSDMRIFELPNGWAYTIGIGDWRDYQGKNYEGIGIAPDILVRNDSLMVINGKDEVLEKALKILTK
jgi:C-terminal processing protease CtpA/Prc